MYAAEAQGLRALRAAGVRAPAPIAHGVRGGAAFIEMERLELGARADWPAMGRMLAALHRNVSDRFGWAADNWIGLSPQRNALSSDWAGFFRDYRLLPQIERARKKGYALEMPSLSLLERHRPQASLVHGDLWGSNAGFTAQGPVIFDPAVYYGDREVDLAMSELFGGFPTEFYSAYQDAFPLDPGYESRKPLYNLYHLLNHLNLFGAGYLAQVQATLRLLLRCL
jgi:fructosamine-3-kinase